VATRTVIATSTPTPASCLNLGRKIALVIDILRRLGARQKQRRYRARDDLNANGVIDLDDLRAVIDAPPCHRRR
jgi:hypothetical protein